MDPHDELTALLEAMTDTHGDKYWKSVINAHPEDVKRENYPFIIVGLTEGDFERLGNTSFSLDTAITLLIVPAKDTDDSGLTRMRHDVLSYVLGNGTLAWQPLSMSRGWHMISTQRRRVEVLTLGIVQDDLTYTVT